MIGELLAMMLSFMQQIFAALHPIFYVFVPYWTLILTALAISPLTVLVPQLLQGKLSWPSRKDVPDEWIIDGRRYNLTPFYASHPGGAHVLRACKGSDCTGLFESYHVFIDREVLLKMLALYEIKDAPPADPPAMVFSDEFYMALKQMAREHFKGKPKGSHKMTWPHLALCLVAWIAMWYCIFVMLTTSALWTIPAIGVLSWYLTGNVMHDASHNALVTRPWLNRALSHAAFPYGVNVGSWRIQHVFSHHIYTNEENDVDLYHFDPLVILEKGKCSVPLVAHIVRLFYILSSAIPHLAFVVPYGLLFGQIDPAHGHRMYDRVKAIRHHRAELRTEMAIELLLLFPYYGLCYYCHGSVAKALAYQMSVYVVSSYLFCFFTQVSHLQEECFPAKIDDMAFAKRQVLSSMDFSANSAFWGHVSGGLNTQAIHHIFPSVSAMHLRDMYPKFRKVCKEHGVDLKEAPSIGASSSLQTDAPE